MKLFASSQPACRNGSPLLHPCFKFIAIILLLTVVQLCGISRAEARVYTTNDVAAVTTVSGKVTDETGAPMEGVNVRLKGMQSGVITNKNGFYKISISDTAEAPVLVASFIGYGDEEAAVDHRSSVNFILKPAVKMMDETVVIAYGVVRKKDLTGSVGSIKMEDLKKAPVQSFEEALAGRVAGVQVNSADGSPGGTNSIVIRGQNSITQSNAPLYVIDGFPLEDPNNNSINPKDIASIEILKDASATAIYGARGANGVILITTKDGVDGKTKISYDGYIGWSKIIKKMDLLSPYEFVKLQPATSSYFKNGKTAEDYRNAAGIDWQDKVFQTAPVQEHNINLSGGANGTKYYFTGSYRAQEGTILNSGYDRVQGRLKLSQRVNKNLNVGLNANYSSTKKYGVTTTANGDNGRSTGLLYSVLGYRPLSADPTLDLEGNDYDPDVDIANDYRYNPVETVKNTLEQSFTKVLQVNAYLDQKILKNLTLRVSGGFVQQAVRNVSFYNSHTRQGNPVFSAKGPNGSEQHSERLDYLNENTLTFNQTFAKKHRLNILGGFTLQGTNVRANGVTVEQLPTEELGIDGFDEGIPSRVVASSSRNTLASFLGRINYTYNTKYLLTLSFRSDGSSKFAEKNRWSYFPSGAFAWRLGDEPFMKHLPFISDAKLRVSYGVTGNNRVSDFAYMSAIQMPYDASYMFNNTLTKGSYPTVIGNPDLRWETTHQGDVGLEFSLFKNVISVEVDYYRKRTKNLLLLADIPRVSGFDNTFKNIGAVDNQGFEFTLNTRNIQTKNFKWNSNFNISFNKNKVVSLTQDQNVLLSTMWWDSQYRTIPLYIAEVGHSIAQFYGYIWDGNYQLSDFMDNGGGNYTLKPNVPTNGAARANIRPGDIKYRDLNGDGVVDTYDMTVIGNPNPDFTGGFSNNIQYRNFDLNVLVQFVSGNQIVNGNRLVFEGGSRVNQNQFADYASYWTPANPSNEYYRPGGAGPNAYSTRVVEDGSFIRLKTVSLGYNFPKKWLNMVKVSAGRIYFSAQNLYTWTKYKGYDPEVSVNNSALTPAFDYSAYPRARTFVMGLNFSF